MRKILALLPLCLIFFTPVAYADKPKGDLFSDQNFYLDPTPLGIYGQGFHHNDVFGPPKNYMSLDKDMFDHTKPLNTYGGGDMFGHRRKHMDEPYAPLFKGVPNKE